MQPFSSAEELMEHLKKQIIQYPNTDESEVYTIEPTGGNLYGGNSAVDLTKFRQIVDSNNDLWNVSSDRPITSHRKLSGKFIVFGKKVVRKLLRWYVSKPFEMQTAFNGSVTRSFNELYNVVIQLSAKQEQNESLIKEQQNYIQKLEHKLSSIDSRGEIKREVEKIRPELEELKHELSSGLGKVAEKHESDIAAVRQTINISSSELAATVFGAIDHKMNGMDEKFSAEINFMQYRLRQIKKQAASQHYDDIAPANHPLEPGREATDSNSFDYLHFENKFRGSVEEIKQRQMVYLPYFVNKENVLDIGCGRGEFIELMIENNVSVKGIDLNQEMVEYCQDRGLPVEYDDAISYLKTVADNELGGIFLGQVIEHLTFEQIITLVELSYSKLKPGSYLIMETPNPLSLAIFYRTFYVDPTHVKPVHPLTIQYLVEAIGFHNTEIKYSSRVEPNWWLPNLDVNDASISNLNEFNAGINRINELLYGNLDYAIIAKK